LGLFVEEKGETMRYLIFIIVSCSIICSGAEQPQKISTNPFQTGNVVVLARLVEQANADIHRKAGEGRAELIQSYLAALKSLYPTIQATRNASKLDALLREIKRAEQEKSLPALGNTLQDIVSIVASVAQGLNQIDKIEANGISKTWIQYRDRLKILEVELTKTGNRAEASTVAWELLRTDALLAADAKQQGRDNTEVVSNRGWQTALKNINGPVLSPAELVKFPEKYTKQCVTVYGRVTHAVKGIGGLDYYILDGVLRCQFPLNSHYTQGMDRETRRNVLMTGTAVGRHHVTAAPDLVDCVVLY
jgi:hypothetical protein